MDKAIDFEPRTGSSTKGNLVFLGISLLPFGRKPALPGFTPDHKTLVVPNEGSDNVSIVSLESLEVVHTIALRKGSSPWQAKTIPPEGRFAYVSNSRFIRSVGDSPDDNSTVNLLDLDAGTIVDEIEVGSGANGVTVDPKGRRGYVVNMRSNTVSVLDVRKHKVIGEIKTDEAPAFAKLTLDGELLVVTNLKSSTVNVVETDTLRVIKTVQTGVADLADSYPQWGPGDTTGIAISADRKAFITNYRSHSIVVLDLDTFEAKKLESPIKFPFFVEIDRKTDLVLFSSGIEKTLAVLDGNSLEWLGVYPNDGSAPLHPGLADLNLWMTDPENNRLTAILPNGIDGISVDWDRNMVTKFM